MLIKESNAWVREGKEGETGRERNGANSSDGLGQPHGRRGARWFFRVVPSWAVMPRSSWLHIPQALDLGNLPTAGQQVLTEGVWVALCNVQCSD